MNQNDEFQALQHINKLITLAENNNFKELNKEHRKITESIFYDYVAYFTIMFLSLMRYFVVMNYNLFHYTLRHK